MSVDVNNIDFAAHNIGDTYQRVRGHTVMLHNPYHSLNSMEVQMENLIIRTSDKAKITSIPLPTRIINQANTADEKNRLLICVDEKGRTMTDEIVINPKNMTWGQAETIVFLLINWLIVTHTEMYKADGTKK